MTVEASRHQQSSMRRVNKSGKSHFHKKRLLQARRWTKICPGPALATILTAANATPVPSPFSFTSSVSDHIVIVGVRTCS